MLHRDDFCSFCGKHEVKRMIAGPRVLVCNECINIMHDLIHDKLPPDPPPEPRRPLAPRLAEFRKKH